MTCCDICQRPTSGLLYKCACCGKEYCSTCEAIVCGCIHQPDICKSCGEIEGVKMAIEKYVNPLVKILSRRNRAISKQKPK